MKINDELVKKYTTTATKVPTRPGCWDVLRVEVFDGGVKCGEYGRNYSSMYSTFHPFSKGGKHYALYSPQYTATRVMSLPDCKDLGGEEAHGNGFCPTGYAVPYEEYCYQPRSPEDPYPEGAPVGGEEYKAWWERNPFISRMFDAEFGFVCGCVWGDDSGGWKLEYLDLSRAHEGVIKREARLGYCELFMPSSELHLGINVEEWEPENQQIGVAVLKRFDLLRPVKD